jgi:hypothetical protein
MKEYLIGVLGEDDGINGFLDQWVQRDAGPNCEGQGGVWNQVQVLLPFPAFLLSLWSFRPVREKPRNPNEFDKIKVN